jgi:HEXXH motif-containing protein
MPIHSPTGFLSLSASNETRTITRKVHLLAIRTLLTWPAATLEGRLGRSLAALQSQLAMVLKDDPEAMILAIGLPEVITPLLTMRAGIMPAEPLLKQLVPPLLAAIHAQTTMPILWSESVTHLAKGGTLFPFSPPVHAMVADASGVEVETATGERIDLKQLPGQPSVLQIRDHIELALFDDNPLRMNEAHPEKSGNALSFGGKTHTEWLEALNDALTLIHQTLPEWYRELPHSLQRIVPVGFEPEMHLSASYREAPGTIYMTLHPSKLTLAEAMIHEVQHGKVNATSWLDPILHNGMTTWTTSPVRPDLRPIWGVLLAAHAFVPVAMMHHRMRTQNHPISTTPHFTQRQQEVLAGNHNALQLVRKHAQPTPLGERIITGLETLHNFLMENNPFSTHEISPNILPPG